MPDGNNIYLELRPTFAEIDTSALVHNVKAVQSLVGNKLILASIKSNGYGHGLIEVARVFQSAGVQQFGVACIEEGIALRKAGIDAPILVFGGLLEAQLNLYLEHNLDITAPSITKLQQIDAAAAHLGKRARVHLKIDTGLERIGVHYYSAESLLEAAAKVKSCDVVAVYSHFADAENADRTVTNLQLERFLEVVDRYQRYQPAPFLRHIANSGGVLYHPESHLDMVRPGLMLYGVYPTVLPTQPVALRAAMKLLSKVVYFKVVKAGAGVSYGHRWKPECDTRVVTIPIGYGDGYSRAFSNRAQCIIRGKKYPVVGSVCMDQLMVDIGQGEAYNGDEVVLFGTQGGETIRVEELAELVGTTPHEILVALLPRIPRVYV